MEETETDYLRPVGKTGRVIAGILCTFFSALFLLVGVVFGLDALRPKIDSPGDSSWTAAAIVIGIGLFMGFFGWRILRGTNSANGVTSTPTWFLQLCGVLYLTGVAFLMYTRIDSWWLWLMIGLPPGLFLILLPKHLAKKRE